jgi:ATP-dependent RNA helicase DDX19/DBP5
MITLKHEELTVEGIKQFFFDCDSEETKYETLLKFYGMLVVNSSIIFCKVSSPVHLKDHHLPEH